MASTILLVNFGIAACPSTKIDRLIQRFDEAAAHA
jgi:hypothetical protein